MKIGTYPQLMMAKRTGTLSIILIIFSFALLLLKTAWVNDDAYITFRTIDNFVNGYGLTWNTAERVQAYTHPLWMLLLSGAYLFTREIYYSSLGISIIISLLAVIVFAFKIAPSLPMAILGVTILILSKAYVDYSTSGLENPLNHLLFILFLFVYLKSEINLTTFFWLTLIAGLAALNRLDTLLLYLPAIGYTFIRLKNWKGIFLAIAGFLPLILWELFSLFYYGFFFPNTAYAKLNINIDSRELIERGLFYLQNSLLIDPITLIIITGALIILFIEKQWRNLPIAAGILLYLAYVVRIGGDFMSGRFLTAPLIGAVVLLSVSQVLRGKLAWGLSLTGVIIIGFASPYPPVLSGPDYGVNHKDIDDPRGVTDERAFYYKYTGLFRTNWQTEPPNHPRMEEGKAARQNRQEVMVRGGIGFFGFYAGPTIHVLDRFSLGDPLLARLPPQQNPEWVIGHFSRRIPDGYEETLLSGKNQLQDEFLASYYDKLSLITRANLYDISRLREIWNMNSGKYDYLLEAYKPPIFQVDLNLKPGQDYKTLWSPADNLEKYAGIRINLGQKCFLSQIPIRLVAIADEEILDTQKKYNIFYYDGDILSGYDGLTVPPVTEDVTDGFLPVPMPAAQQGYDNIQIFPIKDDYIGRDIYRIHSVKLPE